LIAIGRGYDITNTKREAKGAIVAPTDFDLNNDMDVAKKLAEDDPEWNENSQTNIAHYRKENKFKDWYQRAIITNTVKLKDKFPFIISAVGPKGTDMSWEYKFKDTFDHVLHLAEEHGLEYVDIPSLITGFSALNQEGKVIITPTKEAEIAIAAATEFIQHNEQPTLKQIFFLVSGIGDTSAYFFAFKKALGLLLEKEEQKAKDLEQEYIEELENKPKHKKRTKRFKKELRILKWKKGGVLGLAILIALLYMIKKLYSSR